MTDYLGSWRWNQSHSQQTLLILIRMWQWISCWLRAVWTPWDFTWTSLSPMPSRRSLRSALTRLFRWARLFRDVLSKMPDLINKCNLWLVILLYSDCDTGLAIDIHADSVENCRPLDITRSNSLDPENVFLTLQTWNYFSCCGLCTYQEGCHYFRWESQNRTCSLLSSNTKHDVLKCSVRILRSVSKIVPS